MMLRTTVQPGTLTMCNTTELLKRCENLGSFLDAYLVYSPEHLGQMEAWIQQIFSKAASFHSAKITPLIQDFLQRKGPLHQGNMLLLEEKIYQNQQNHFKRERKKMILTVA